MPFFRAAICVLLAAAAVETNLMEKRGQAGAIASSGRELVIPTGPYEIKTVDVTFAVNR
jgi:hypothetical protein